MPLLHVFYALLVVAFWGANFVASKFALAHFPPILATTLRFFLLLPLLAFVPRPNVAQTKFLMLLSLFGVAHFTLPQASLAAGLDIATCAILNQLAVPFACVMGVCCLGETLGMRRLLGLCLAFCGMILVLGSPHISGSWWGSVYAIAAACCFGIYNMMLKRHPEMSALQVLAYVFLFGLPQLWLLSWWLEAPDFQLLRAAPALAWWGIAYTVVCSTIVGHGLWNYLVQRHPVSMVSPFALLVPVAGIACGQIFYDEPLTWQLLLGGAVTLFGVGMIVLRPSRWRVYLPVLRRG